MEIDEKNKMGTTICQIATFFALSLLNEPNETSDDWFYFDKTLSFPNKIFTSVLKMLYAGQNAIIARLKDYHTICWH